MNFIKRTSFVFLLLVGLSLNVSACLPKNNVTNNFSPIFYAYDNVGYGKFKVYVQVKENKYIFFNIEHEVSDKQYKNLWRVKDSYLCEYVGNEMKSIYQVLTPGENEFVWFTGRPNVSEAVGGFHGNERIDLDTASFIHFVADGKRLNLSTHIPLTACNSFYYEQHSTMHQVGTGGLINSPNYLPVKNHPIECYHVKKTTFADKGYTTYNKVTWTDNKASVKRMFYGIFCVSKNISKYGYNDIKNRPKNTIEFNDDGNFKLNSPDQRVVMYDNSKGISVVCDSRVLTKDEFNLNTMVWDHAIYHKYYSAIQNDDLIFPESGDVWETEAYIRFELKN